MSAASQDLPIGNEIPVVKDPNPPSVIIFKEIDIEVDVANRDLNIVYLPMKPRPTVGIDAFIDDVVKRATTRAAPGFPDRSPLDLNCSEDAYIVFKLASGWNWQFAADGKAFSTKADQGDRYFNLVLVTYDAATNTVQRYRGGERVGEGCKLLYFRARGDTLGYSHGFNLIAELDLGLTPTNPPEKRRTKLVIDPDVRHPGGTAS